MEGQYVKISDLKIEELEKRVEELEHKLIEQEKINNKLVLIVGKLTDRIANSVPYYGE